MYLPTATVVVRVRSCISFPSAELQLKSYHLPCKLFKRWKDLLSQFTNATYEEVCEGNLESRGVTVAE